MRIRWVSRTPWDRSGTVSWSGHRVATIRRRKSARSLSGTSMWKERIESAVECGSHFARKNTERTRGCGRRENGPSGQH
jgi:hypothetical protein